MAQRILLPTKMPTFAQYLLMQVLLENPSLLMSLMQAPIAPLTHEEDLLASAYLGNVEDVRELLDAHPDLDVNTQDPESGRTALHHASNCDCTKHKKIEEMLLKHKGVNSRLRDKEGFTVAELKLNPHPFDPNRALGSESMQKITAEINYFVSEINVILASNRHEDKHLVIVNNTEEMVDYVNQHPTYSQIGFLVLPPHAIRKDGHCSPILFIRSKDPFDGHKVESFVQLDSVARAYLIPKSEIERTVYFSMVPRQITNVGCDKDAILLLTEIMTRQPTILNFCKLNSKKSNLLQPLNLEEIAQDEKLAAKEFMHKIGGPALTPEEKFCRLNFELRKLALIQKKALKGNGREPITSIRYIDIWPKRLFQFVAYFNVIHQMRVDGILGDKKSTAMVSEFLKTATLRTPRMDPKEVLENLENPDKKYDFASEDWRKRNRDWANQREKRYNTVKRLFHAKFQQANFDELKEKQKENIVEKIAGYAVGR